MAEACEECEAWEMEQYWNLPPEKHSFFKIMLGDFRNKLRVPRKFWENFKGKWLKKVNLRGPSGDVWTTELVQEKKDIVFASGWERFVKDHGLENYDFLTFRYIGISCFDVVIFDKTGCEREHCHFVSKNQTFTTTNCCSMRRTSHLAATTADFSSDKESSDESDQNYKVSSESSTPPSSPDLSKGKKPQVARRIRTRASDTNVTSADNEARPSKKPNKKNSRASAEKKKNAAVSDVEGSDDWLDEEEHSTLAPAGRRRSSKTKRIRYLISNRRTITDEEKEEALRMAKKHVDSLSYSCYVKLKPSHVYHGFILTIPKHFADTHLKKDCMVIILRLQHSDHKAWKVKFNRFNFQGTFNKGWAEFVRDNNLETEDVCVFSPASDASATDDTQAVLDVSIFRVVEDEIVKPNIL